MNEDLKPNDSAENTENKKQPEIIVNNYGATKDDAVVIEEDERTVLLTADETIIIEKEPRIDIVPKNRLRKIYGGMWGPIEIATAGLGLLAVLAMIILVVLIVLPAQKKLEDNKAQRDKLENDLNTARGKYGSITTTEARVAELIESVNDFETRFLRIPTAGKTDLYQRINGLISGYGLINTTGPDYAPLEITDDTRRGQENENERGRAKFQSIFPGVYVTMTVEGSYQNLRRFIREIETSNQFIVISTIELQPSENEDRNKTAQPAQAAVNNEQLNPTSPAGVLQNQTFEQTLAQTPTRVVQGRTRGETVSLRLEMAAYFRRPDFQPVELGVSSQ